MKYDLLTRARTANADLHNYLTASDEGMPPEWLLKHAYALAKEVYRDIPHWHKVNGKCIEGVPFEVMMLSLSLLTTTWVADIFLRKARDRGIQAMEEWWEYIHSTLFQTMDEVKWKVKSTRDEPAEQAYKRERRRPSRLRHLLKTLFWGH